MDSQATFSCSFTQTDLGPVAELPSLPHWPAQRLLPGLNPTLILVANSSQSSESRFPPSPTPPSYPDSALASISTAGFFACQLDPVQSETLCFKEFALALR